MKVGRELDALVAEKVMGWFDGEECWSFPWTSREHISDNTILKADWMPSADIADAWQVVEKMGNADIDIRRVFDGYFIHKQIESLWKITPLDICLAALSAIGVKTA